MTATHINSPTLDVLNYCFTDHGDLI